MNFAGCAKDPGVFYWYKIIIFNRNMGPRQAGTTNAISIKSLKYIIVIY